VSLFLAWMPEGEALRRLAGLRDACRRADTARVWKNWRLDAQLHMTLRFLTHGMPQDRAAFERTLACIACAHAPIAISLDRVTGWSSALVARTSSAPALSALLKDLKHAAERAGDPLLEAQRPHATLAYPPDEARGRRALPAPDCNTLPLPVRARIETIRLVQTAFHGYETLAQWPLSGPSTRQLF
jgi:2'-5' RNA ligase